MRPSALVATAAFALFLRRTSGQECDVLFESYLNDGYCDELTGEEYNSASCSWDGGDCCESTCITSLYTCGYSGYNCKDESASDFLNGTCAVHASTVGDGYCDAFYYSSDAHLNTEACGWDGGDCCPSTCVGDCDHVVYECKDPEARDYNTTSDCHAPHPSWLADGYCDDDGSDSGSLYNSGVCSWDGGDCCATTCVDGTYTCGLNHDSTRYRCRDPEASDYVDPDNCTVPHHGYLADGYCDYSVYNVKVCGWDGGDCCPDTCEDGEQYECGYNNFIECLDPNSTYSGDFVTTTPDGCATEYPSYIGDGYCDHIADVLNTADCGWDGGDCCQDTCESGSYTCGSIGFQCLDPDSSTYAACPAMNSTQYGDGYCDQYTYDLDAHLNSANCQWDGGDCCPSTCMAADESPCSSNIVYDCLDPEASDYGAVSDCAVASPSWLGDAYCDASGGYNTAACNWDNGDCCASTCLQESNFYACGTTASYVCLDPNSTERSSLPVDCNITFPSWVADGYCDELQGGYNTLRCGWDGGDCCASTCSDGDTWTCGSSEYFCKDPIASDTSELTCATDIPSYVGDGYCDHTEGLNIKSCDWDGGDCCESTCDSSAEYYCGTIGYHCVDPKAEEGGVCVGNTTAYYADGYCDHYHFDLDLHLNSALCSWDGGDCCPSTCVASEGQECTNLVYRCLDPAASDFNTTSTCKVSAPSWIGDAYCDNIGSYNTEVCGWDGGDCCIDTCEDEANYYDCGPAVTDCRDPGSEYYFNYALCMATHSSWLGDGYCDDESMGYNTALCNWDAGDCCESTCLDGTFYSCGHVDYICKNPDIGTAPSTRPAGSPTPARPLVPSPEITRPPLSPGPVRQGMPAPSRTVPPAPSRQILTTISAQSSPATPTAPAPSHDNPTPCWLTPAAHTGGCDTSSGNTGPIPAPAPGPSPSRPAPAPTECIVETESYLQDAYCDGLSGGYNTAACNWDGGDCCASTCENTDDYYCGSNGYTCRDPEANDFGACPGRNSIYYADGFCDMFHFDLSLHLNTLNCDWDGGDCCVSTCIPETGQLCDNVVFDCLDPDANDYGAESDCRVAAPSWIGDAYCDPDGGYNTDACDWDGGDCCEDSCVPQTSTTGYDCTAAFFCSDPQSPYYLNLADCDVDMVSWLGDGYCEIGDGVEMYNTEACQWDGGDCCESTCVDGSYTCGYNGYDCVDPSGTTPLATTTTTATTTSVATTTSTLPIACDVEFPSYIGDAYCDALDDAYNTAACSWDGGDCCLHTCMTSDDYTCGVVGYSCRDPTSIDFGACPGVDSIFYGDGYCDTYNYALHLHLNTLNCDWDGGDCCESTCETPTGGHCDGIVYDCLDPKAEDFGTVSDCEVVSPSWISDGYCDSADGGYNTDVCGWDGGDCCPDTCIDRSSTTGYDCTNGFQCFDPDSPFQLESTTSTPPTTSTTPTASTTTTPAQATTSEVSMTSGIATTSGVVGGVDENGCCIGCGEQYCESTSSCFFPWLETCDDSTSSIEPSSTSSITSTTTSTTADPDIANAGNINPFEEDESGLLTIVVIVVVVVVVVVIIVVVVAVVKGKAKYMGESPRARATATPTHSQASRRSATYITSVEVDTDDDRITKL